VTGERAKPTVADLGIDPAALEWQRSGDGAGSIEIAFPVGPAPPVGPVPVGPVPVGPAPAGQGAQRRWARGDWVLMRVAGDPAGRVLVFDRNEWECFIDGARNGEFDDAAGPVSAPAESEGLDL
jgi:hypothetical protein